MKHRAWGSHNFATTLFISHTSGKELIKKEGKCQIDFKMKALPSLAFFGTRVSIQGLTWRK